jgi:prophage DNA circulation protein
LNAQAINNEIVDALDFGTNLEEEFGLAINAAQAFDVRREAEKFMTLKPLVPNEGKDEKAIRDLMRVVGAGMEAGALATIEFDSVDEAEEAMASFVTRLDSLIESIDLDDETYQALCDLRARVFEAIDSASDTRPFAVLSEETSERNALELAFEMYGDPERAEEIIRRNKLIHPGFISAGAPVKLRSDQ